MSAWQDATIAQFSTRGKVDKAQCAQYAAAAGESVQVGGRPLCVPRALEVI
jgi:hypothetical protein